MSLNVVMLDCTFRDGGYYNQWDFDGNLVRRYLDAMLESGIDYVELGFRNFPQSEFFGAFAYTTDEYISALNVPKNLKIGVMVDAKSILNGELSVQESVGFLFNHSNQSPVELVRVASHFSEVSRCEPIVKELKRLGYVVGLNLMQAGGKPDLELENAARAVDSWDVVDVLYFADSLGNMDAEEVQRIVAALKKGWGGQLGIHTHNNKGRAIDNTDTALDAGVCWVDGTVSGMGRGAGNAQTEILLIELNRKYGCSYKFEGMFDLVLNDFSSLQKEYGWGANLFYFLAANFDIHPTYIQEMISDKRYGSREILEAIKYMEGVPSKSFNSSILSEVSLSKLNSGQGNWDATGFCEGREVLIVGSGSSIERYSDAIINYIAAYDPYVISLNLNKFIPEKYIDMFLAAHDARILMDLSQYKRDVMKPVAMPISSLGVSLGDSLGRDMCSNLDIKDYGMKVEDGKFELHSTHCVVPLKLSMAYALAVSSIGSAKSICLVGFDGYSFDDPRQSDMQGLLEDYSNREFAIPIKALTPTNYNVQQGSIYAPRS